MYGGLSVRLQVPTYPHLWRPEQSRHAAFNAVCNALNRSVTGRMTDGTGVVRLCAARVSGNVQPDMSHQIMMGIKPPQDHTASLTKPSNLIRCPRPNSQRGASRFPDGGVHSPINLLSLISP
uniref:Uncharacterized protein n=1 Tax=Oryza sativa subsp. japonica TaxID=39947 RepID=Q8LNG4_ORYSJ|nr:hypothetical protein [Oryza sativa Japonica Group]